MEYLFVIIFIIGILLILAYRGINRNSGFFEVVDENGKTRTFGNYNQCKSWINDQQGMESLTGKISHYKIKKKNF